MQKRGKIAEIIDSLKKYQISFLVCSTLFVSPFYCRSPTSTSDSGMVNWKPFNIADQNYLSISTNHVTLKSHLRAEKVSFWNNLIPQLIKKIRSRDLNMESVFTYKVYIWITLAMSCLLIVVVVLLSCLLISTNRRREALEMSATKTTLSAPGNCNSSVKPQML